MASYLGVDLDSLLKLRPVEARFGEDIMEQVDPIFCGDPKTAAMKVLGG